MTDIYLHKCYMRALRIMYTYGDAPVVRGAGAGAAAAAVALLEPAPPACSQLELA